jgi:ArsR family transcriptional regulator
MKKILPVFEALSDPVRLKIIHFIASNKEVTCPQVIEYIQLSQPAISHHAKILKQAGIIQCRKEGTRNFYSLKEEYLQECGINPQRLAEIQLNDNP